MEKKSNMKDLMILQMMQGSNDGQMNPMFMMAMMDKGGNNSMIETYAPIVQRIEHRPPKSGIQVRVLLGARREL